jgi:hypothetical protein
MWYMKIGVLFPACRQAGFDSFLLHEQKKRMKAVSHPKIL